MVPSALVGSLMVVVLEEGCEVAAESGDRGLGGGDEGGFPAFVEDGVLDLFDLAVGLGTSRGDEPMPGSELVEGLGKAGVDGLGAPGGG